MNDCQHKNVYFVGAYSLVGHYKCRDCGAELCPVEYAKSEGTLNIALIDYYTENPERLHASYRDHPWVSHLYEHK